MIGALLLGFFAGFIGRAFVPNDAFADMSGPKSWLVSIVLGLVGAMVGWLIFTGLLGIGDDAVFDWGGILERSDRRGDRAAPHRVRDAPRRPPPRRRTRLSLGRLPLFLDSLKNWMSNNNAAIMAVLCLVIGAKLIGDAVSGFSG